jgi:hypothetical protein
MNGPRAVAAAVAFSLACSAYDPPAATEPAVDGPCCGGLGTCAPAGLLTAEQRSALPADLCSAADQVCVPSALTHGGLVACGARPSAEVPGFAGACLPECFLGALGPLVPRAACGNQERCVPCAVTAAVGLACD